MSRLSWISDEDLEKAVCEMLGRAQASKTDAEKRLRRNVVDPFASLILAATLVVRIIK